MKSESMSVVPVKIKWNKQQFEDVEFDLSGDVAQFKTQLYSLTGTHLLNMDIRPIPLISSHCRCPSGATKADGEGGLGGHFEGGAELG